MDLFITLFEKQRDRQRESSIYWFTSQLPRRARAGPVQSQELNEDVFYGWQSPKHLSYPLLPPQVHSDRKLDPEVGVARTQIL